MPYGPWIQDPDIVVACGRVRALRDADSGLGVVDHAGGYVLADINNDIATVTGPALAARTTNDLSGYSAAVAAIPSGVATEYSVNINRTNLNSDGYDLNASFFNDVLHCQPFPHGWEVPYLDGLPHQVEDDAEPVVIEGHVELVHTQALENHIYAAALNVYQYSAVDLLPVSGPSLVQSHAFGAPEAGPTPPTFETVIDLAGDALTGVLLNNFISFSPGSWEFDATVATTDNIRARISTAVDTAASYYVWRPPRYRYLFPTDPPRRLRPRTDSAGPAIGRLYPPPNTPQGSGRTGPSSPY